MFCEYIMTNSSEEVALWTLETVSVQNINICDRRK
jgi:hypothetical protein